MEENKNTNTQETVIAEKAPAEQASKATPNNNPKGRKDFRPRRRVEREVKEFEERVVAINRISKTVKGGRKMRFAAIMVVGDKKGRVGYGIGKAKEVPEAIRKATEEAKKNVVRIKFVDNNRTIPHDTVGIFGASRVVLKPAAEGTGIVAGGAVRAILELAGATDVLTKCVGSRTPINQIHATMKALVELKTVDSVAKLRGIKVSEVR